MAGPYSNLVDLKKYIPADIIMQLTDDNNIGTIITETVDDAINQADNIIDAYMRGRYPYEMATADVPAFINDISVKLTAYNLYRRKLQATLPEAIMNDYKLSLQMLKDIQAGKITPWASSSEPTVVLSNCDSDTKKYSKTKWREYE